MALYKGRPICPRNAIVGFKNYRDVLQTPYGHGRVPNYMPFSLSVFIRRLFCSSFVVRVLGVHEGLTSNCVVL